MFVRVCAFAMRFTCVCVFVCVWGGRACVCARACVCVCVRVACKCVCAHWWVYVHVSVSAFIMRACIIVNPYALMKNLMYIITQPLFGHTSNRKLYIESRSPHESYEKGER